jgi:transposase
MIQPPSAPSAPRGEAPMVRLGELMMILELHRQGVSITAIARRTGRDPKTIRKYIERGIEAPAYGPRCAGRPSKLAAYLDFLRERVTAFPDLSAARLTREIRELGYVGAYTAVKRYLAAIRPQNGPKPFEVAILHLHMKSSIKAGRVYWFQYL